MEKITVKTIRDTYPVLIGDSVFNRLPSLLEKQKLNNNVFVIIDENVAAYHLSNIKSYLSKPNNRTHYFEFPSGEKHKSEYQLKKIYSTLLKKNFGRDTTLIAIGGGVTGDIAGYAAATYMRGIPFINVPTTLLAMIDAAIGGKTGINFSKKKNLIGAFYQPQFVFIDTMFLSTLPSKEFNSALGELIKYGLISDKIFFNFLSENIERIKSKNKKTIKQAIVKCVNFKAGVVSQDEFEQKGIRKILNFGHTFAHAIESNLGFRINHGEAVVAGIVSALFLSNKIGFLTNANLTKMLTLPARIHLPRIIHKINNEKVFNAMQSDKKNRNEELMFVLISEIGRLIVDVPAKKRDIYFALDKMKVFFLV